MLNMTEKQKRMFYTSGYSNNYILTFHDTGLVITNETIHSETPVIKESICDEEEFTLGGCIASSMEFEVSEILSEEISGLEYTAQLEVKNESGEVVLTVPMGVYRVDSAKQAEDKDYKKVTAYDRMYDISEDVAAWYNEYFAGDATHTVKETRESLLTYLWIPFVVQNLPNDDVMLEKTMEVTSMPGTDVLRALCVINGGFGRMNREGKFEVIGLTGFGLFPEDSQGEDGNLYPSETLYPEDYFEYLGMSDGENACPEYRSCKYEEYMTMPITCLNIQSTTDDVGVTVGEDLTNPYVITANFFLYGKSQDELTEIGQNILGRIKGVTYRPNTTELNGLPYLECGDVFALEKKNDSVESYILSRTISGIQALKDTYEAKGNYLRANDVSSNDEIIQLKGKSLEIKKSVEGLTSEVKDFEKDTTSKFEQTAETISAEVERAKEAEGKLSSEIKVAAGQVVLKADANGNIVEVALSADPKEGTKFTVSAKNIELSADEVIALLSGGTINLSAGKGITIESPYFSVDKDSVTIGKDGNTIIKDGELTTGSVTADAIAADAITAEKIATDAVTADAIEAGSITSDKIAANAITSENIDTEELFAQELTAYNFNVNGGKISLDTSNSPDNLIILRNLETDAKDSNGNLIDVKYFGEGLPTSEELEKFEVGDIYMNLSTSAILQFDGIVGSQSPKFTPIATSNTPKTYWYETTMNTQEGFSVTQYYIKNGKKWGNSVEVYNGRITLKKDFYQTSGQESQEVNIIADYVHGSSGVDMEVGLCLDSALEIPELQFKTDSASKIQLQHEKDLGIDFLKVFGTDNGISADNVRATNLIIGNRQLMCGSIVYDYSVRNWGDTHPYEYIDAPGIACDMPATVCNGDCEAQDITVSDIQIIYSSGKIRFRMTEPSMSPARFSYSYWKEV